MISWQDLDLNQPLDWAHPLNRGRVAWWLALPQGYGAPFWFDLVKGQKAVLSGLTGTDGWSSRSYPNGPHSLLLSGAAGERISFPLYTVGAAYSLTCWLQWLATPNTVVCGSDSNTQTHAYLLYVDGTKFYTDQGVLSAAHNGITVGQWYHCAVTRTASGTVSFYKNATLLGTGSDSNNPVVSAWGGYDRATSNFSLNGRLAMGALWNRCLGAGEIFADYSLSQQGYRGVLNYPSPDAIALLLSPSGASSSPLVFQPFVSRPRFEPAYFE